MVEHEALSLICDCMALGKVSGCWIGGAASANTHLLTLYLLTRIFTLYLLTRIFTLYLLTRIITLYLLTRIFTLYLLTRILRSTC